MKEKNIYLLAKNKQSANRILDKFPKLASLFPIVLLEGETPPAKSRIDVLFYEKGTDPSYLSLKYRDILVTRAIDLKKKNFAVVTGKVKKLLKVSS